MKHALSLALCLAAAPQTGAAQSPLSAEAFEALTLGKTYTFAESGTPYGAEEYLPGRRVRWSFLDGKCKEGHWWEEAGMICFAYEDNPSPQCWTFFSDGGGLSARFENTPGQTELYEVGRSDAPLMCLGPEIGV